MTTNRLRIAIGGIGHETNTFSPVLTAYDDFQKVRGQDLLAGRPGLPDASAGVELLPTFLAWALPSGLVRHEAYQRLKTELLHEFEALLPLHGVYLNLHGAMEVQALGDAESDLVAAVRALVGPDVLISVSLDLHGNIAPALVQQADILTAYRTAPHRDAEETRQRALAHLVRALQAGLRPKAALVKPPLLLAGESAITETEPARSLYARLTEIERQPGIMDASLLIGCAWTDSPYTSTSVIVVAEQDEATARTQTADLAREVWTRRHDFRYGVETAPVDEAIRRAMQAPERPVFISDSGDNITAGAAGDIPLGAERLLALGAQGALVVGLTDPAAVERCAAAGVGARLSLSIGGKLDQVNGQPLSARAWVEQLSGSPGAPPNTALVRLTTAEDMELERAEVRMILTAERRFFPDRASIAAAGIDPMAQKIVVVKLGYLFPDLYDHAPRAIMALSPGATDLRLEQLPYRRLQRPIFPLDGEIEWTP